MATRHLHFCAVCAPAITRWRVRIGRVPGCPQVLGCSVNHRLRTERPRLPPARNTDSHLTSKDRPHRVGVLCQPAIGHEWWIVCGFPRACAGCVWLREIGCSSGKCCVRTGQVTAVSKMERQSGYDAGSTVWASTADFMSPVCAARHKQCPQRTGQMIPSGYGSEVDGVSVVVRPGWSGCDRGRG
jgi:hypothetical protein